MICQVFATKPGEVRTRCRVPGQVAGLRAAARNDDAAVARAHAVVADQQRRLAHARMRPRRHLLLRRPSPLTLHPGAMCVHTSIYQPETEHLLCSQRLTKQGYGQAALDTAVKRRRCGAA